MTSQRSVAVERFEKLEEMGYSHTDILNYILFNWMNADDACESLEGFAGDMDFSFEEDESEEDTENEIEPTYEVGDTVTIASDNENYFDYLGKDLTVTKVSTSVEDHPAFDDSIGEALYDLETEDGELVPFSLYEYELN